MDSEITAQRVGAGRALIIFVFYIVAQLVAGIIAVLAIAVSVMIVRRIDFMQAMKKIDVYVIPLSFIGAAFVLYVLLRSWTPLWMSEQRADRFGWARLSGRRAPIAAVCGAAIAAAGIAGRARQSVITLAAESPAR